jgi:hypothetical protein
MEASNMSPEMTPEYQQICRDALNDEQAKSLADTDNWSHVNKQQVHSDWDALYKELTPMIQRLPAAAPEIQAMMARHYGIVSCFYAPSKLAYIGMSLFYRENSDMKSFHNGYDANMVDFLGQAMPIYAEKHLK